MGSTGFQAAHGACSIVSGHRRGGEPCPAAADPLVASVPRGFGQTVEYPRNGTSEDMAFQTPITVAKVLDKIDRREYVLPALQREFVWDTDKICRLFDSLMQGYPIGSFLFWQVERENTQNYVFYDIMRRYHEAKAYRCEKHTPVVGSGVTAILDGQQRFTSLYIALKSTYAEKLPRKWKDNPDAYPELSLYLNLTGMAPENELGLKYDFRFLSKDKAAEVNANGNHYFPVTKIITMEAGLGVLLYLQEAKLTDQKSPFVILDRLHAVVHRDQIINYFDEESQDLDKVLNIFIRVNSGGMVLSYSDLLLSIATAQWKDLDARDAVHGLVDELNGIRNGFSFSQDLVLKSGLVLADVPGIQFKVSNFGPTNMHALEKGWKHFARALNLAVRLLADFGFNSQTLLANSVLIPIAYYLHHRGAQEAYLNARGEADDREAIRGWVMRSLLKPGVWGSGLDTLLGAMRDAIRDHGKTRCPVPEIEAAMAKLGKSLKFEDDELKELLSLEYGESRTFLALAVMYPGMDLRNEFHVDHVFPKTAFRRKRLVDAGIPPERIGEVQEMRDRLPNLQLLEGPINISKNDTMPAAWCKNQFTPEKGAAYLDRHDLTDLPTGMVDFEKFFAKRADRMLVKLRKALASSPA
jgi:hypothetical protein